MFGSFGVNSFISHLVYYYNLFNFFFRRFFFIKSKISFFFFNPFLKFCFIFFSFFSFLRSIFSLRLSFASTSSVSILTHFFLSFYFQFFFSFLFSHQRLFSNYAKLDLDISRVRFNFSDVLHVYNSSYFHNLNPETLSLLYRFNQISNPLSNLFISNDNSLEKKTTFFSKKTFRNLSFFLSNSNLPHSFFENLASDGYIDSSFLFHKFNCLYFFKFIFSFSDLGSYSIFNRSLKRSRFLLNSFFWFFFYFCFMLFRHGYFINFNILTLFFSFESIHSLKFFFLKFLEDRLIIPSFERSLFFNVFKNGMSLSFKLHALTSIDLISSFYYFYRNYFYSLYSFRKNIKFHASFTGSNRNLFITLHTRRGSIFYTTSLGRVISGEGSKKKASRFSWSRGKDFIKSFRSFFFNSKFPLSGLYTIRILKLNPILLRTLTSLLRSYFRYQPNRFYISRHRDSFQRNIRSSLYRLYHSSPTVSKSKPSFSFLNIVCKLDKSSRRYVLYVKPSFVLYKRYLNLFFKKYFRFFLSYDFSYSSKDPLSYMNLMRQFCSLFTSSFTGLDPAQSEIYNIFLNTLTNHFINSSFFKNKKNQKKKKLKTVHAGSSDFLEDNISDLKNRIDVLQRRYFR